MVAFFEFHLPPVSLSLRVNRFAAAAVRVAAATGEFFLFLAILLAVAVTLLVIAGFCA